MNIIIPAHSRLPELYRLLGSISRFLPEGSDTEIFVVIDGGKDTIQSEFFIDRFENLKNLEVIRHKTLKGVRENILYCGDLVSETGPGLILEDDLIVGPNFLGSAETLLSIARNTPSISAVSLYNFEYNEFATLPAFIRSSGLTKV